MEKRPFEPFSPRASEKLQSKHEQKPLERQIKFISKLQCWLVWGIYLLKGCCCQKRTYPSSFTSSCVTGMPTDTLSMKEDSLCEWKKHLFCQACANKTCSVLEVDHQNSLIESGIGQNKIKHSTYVFKYGEGMEEGACFFSIILHERYGVPNKVACECM